MDIGILTYYGVHNHGAVLQANGLQQVLRAMGHDVRFLSFERSYEYISEEQTKKYKLGLSSIPFYFKYMLEKGVGNILYNYKKRNTLKAFRVSSFNLDTAYDSFEGDAVVIGSDEVFSLEIGYNPMMYGYGLKAKRIAGYAGSFGPTTMHEIENKGKVESIRKGLDKFTAISVRDQNSQSIIKQLCNKEAPLVCDPVILYGYGKEMEEFKPTESGYIVVYAYDNRMNDPEEVEAVRAYAHAHGLKIYSVGYYHKWCDRCIDASPTELLGWIRNAELTVTDTFHGSIISIICNTPLAVKLRGNANKLAYLLSEYGLSDRIMETFSDLEQVASRRINFSKVNAILKEKREASKRYLISAIEG
ncbi:MAG: polysaccharide pyruvyl transferase family protein [Eubacteriales bacterium]|nr:polysaccharide pyruvyl transferase family protein [Eubacteriales bacterium]